MTQSTTPPAPPPENPPSYQWPSPPGPPARPGIVTAGAVVLLVLGVLTAILGLFTLLAASVFTSGMEIPGLEQLEGTGSVGAIGGIIAIIGGVIVVFGVLQVVSGINLFSARSWARILGIVLAVIGGLFGLLAVIPSSNSNASSPIFGLVLLVANGFVVWALATTGRYFTR